MKSKFKIIVSILKFYLGVNPNQLTGIVDTKAKIYCCYLAQRLTDATDFKIADFFGINPSYMRKRVQEVSVHFLVDQQAKNIMVEMETLYRDLEKVIITQK